MLTCTAKRSLLCLVVMLFLKDCSAFSMPSSSAASNSNIAMDCSTAHTWGPLDTMDRRRVIQEATAALFIGLATTGSCPRTAFAAYLDPSTNLPVVTDKVYLDVAIGNQPLGRLSIGLFGEIMPRASENFKRLCAENAYAGTTFYRVLSDYNIQGGALGDDTGKTSTANVFEPDNFSLRHTVAGLVSYSRATPEGGADSRFFINTQADAGWADDRYAAFGIVLDDGLSTVVAKVEAVPVQRPKNRPTVDVKITASGLLYS